MAERSVLLWNQSMPVIDIRDVDHWKKFEHDFKDYRMMSEHDLKDYKMHRIRKMEMRCGCCSLEILCIL